MGNFWSRSVCRPSFLVKLAFDERLIPAMEDVDGSGLCNDCLRRLKRFIFFPVSDELQTVGDLEAAIRKHKDLSVSLQLFVNGYPMDSSIPAHFLQNMSAPIVVMPLRPVTCEFRDCGCRNSVASRIEDLESTAEAILPSTAEDAIAEDNPDDGFHDGSAEDQVNLDNLEEDVEMRGNEDSAESSKGKTEGEEDCDSRISRNLAKVTAPISLQPVLVGREKEPSPESSSNVNGAGVSSGTSERKRRRSMSDTRSTFKKLRFEEDFSGTQSHSSPDSDLNAIAKGDDDDDDSFKLFTLRTDNEGKKATAVKFSERLDSTNTWVWLPLTPLARIPPGAIINMEITTEEDEEPKTFVVDLVEQDFIVGQRVNEYLEPTSPQERLLKESLTDAYILYDIEG